MNFEFLQLQPELLNSDQWLGVLSGVLVAIVACIYAWQIFVTKLKVNLATWGMILVMDLVGLALAMGTGNGEPFMHVGWVFSDTLILIAALINRGNWHWTRTESLSLFFCVGAIVWWITTQSLWSLFGYLFACVCALYPQAKYYWLHENNARKSAWVWITSSVAIVLTLFAVPTLTLEYSIVSFGLLCLYLTMAYLAYR